MKVPPRVSEVPMGHGGPVKNMAARSDSGVGAQSLRPSSTGCQLLAPFRPLPSPQRWSRGRLRLSTAPARPWERTRQQQVRGTGACREPGQGEEPWAGNSGLRASEGMRPCLRGTHRPLGFCLKLLASQDSSGPVRWCSLNQDGRWQFSRLCGLSIEGGDVWTDTLKH